jgi:hypothetical protein
MSRNPYDLEFKPLNMGGFGLPPPKSPKRTLGTRDKEILYIRAKKKCENCGTKLDLGEMQTGHKQAASRGGKATPSNSVCLCYHCNKLQGTDSWAVFRKKQGKLGTRTVTSGKKGPSKKKAKRNSLSGNYWINPITGRKEKQQPYSDSNSN